MASKPSPIGHQSDQKNSYALMGHMHHVPSLMQGLYIVATPIGNLGDITIRALETLAAADLIACEDTRTTRILTQRYGITTRLFAYHEHNAEHAGKYILDLLHEGKTIALVSDAGTPLISDPGYKLVRQAVEADHKIIPIPGPSALLAGLVASALPSDTVLFAGFLSTKRAARMNRLKTLSMIPATLIFYAPPHRLTTILADMCESFGPGRMACVARELTKYFEEIQRGTLIEIERYYRQSESIKGEIVIVVAPPEEAEWTREDINDLLQQALIKDSPSQAAAKIAKQTGMTKKELYQYALTLSNAAKTLSNAAKYKTYDGE